MNACAAKLRAAQQAVQQAAPQRPRLPAIDLDARLRDVFVRQQVDLVIDVGANLGQFVAEIRGFYRGEVVSFEPIPEVFAALDAVAAQDPLWRCSNWALGRDCGDARLHVCPSHDFSSLLPPNAYCARRFGRQAATQRIVPARMRRMDRALQAMGVASAGRRVFLKMDTQGYDLEVFAGIGDCLEDVVAIQSELSLISLYEGMPHWLHSLAVYEAAGFGVVDLYPITRDTDRVIEYDCLLVRKG